MAVTWPSGSGVCDNAKVAISAPVITKANNITRGPAVMDSATQNDLLSLSLNVDYHDRTSSPANFGSTLRATSEKFRGRSPSFFTTSIEPADRHFTAKP